MLLSFGEEKLSLPEGKEIARISTERLTRPAQLLHATSTPRRAYMFLPLCFQMSGE